MPENPVARERSVRQTELDFLRGVAALFVLFNHARGAFFAGGGRILSGPHGPLDTVGVAALQLTSFGVESVVLFFVLSGFAMAHSVSRSTSVGRFYARRAIRIWPPYIVACLLALGVGLLTGVADLRPLIVPMLFYVVPVHNPVAPQFWSLPYEVLFYSLCPLLLTSRRRVVAVWIVAAVAFAVSPLVAGPLINPWPSVIVNFLTGELFFLMCGALAYHWLDRIPRLSGRALALVAIAAMATAWLTKRWLGEVNILSELAVVAAAVLAIANLPRRVAERKGSNLGFFSYSIYLYHYALLVLIAWLLGRAGVVAGEIRNPLAWLVPAGLALAGCLALYAVTERIANRGVAALRRRPADYDIHGIAPPAAN
ncbi:acyltransferase [Sphingomonas sp. ASV193]|uniref:acyltransferase family protein n=1 Tax=Sphingomonas sp. ASV193 TaxID=3144405 RepID=UPI0032E933C3